MDEVLVAQTLTGLSAINELSGRLTAAVEAQRALADKVGAGLRPVLVHWPQTL